MNDLATAYLASKKGDQTLPLFEAATMGLERRGVDHESAGPIVHNLIDCLEQMKQSERAEAGRRNWQAAGKDKDCPPGDVPSDVKPRK